MSRVRVLPEALANKIAAGEVVERPASVVKELLENALDAGATRVRIEIERGGRSLIQVSDNGTGMSRDDALLAVERYATSKLADDAGLFDIRTLGFRGEALPSVASVSRFALETRPADATAGTRLQINGGRLANVAEVGVPVGTLVSVRQLFFNTPARRKFLRTVNTEMGHIGDVVAAAALNRPDVRFRLIHNDRAVREFRDSDPAGRVVEVLGKELRDALFPMDLSAEGIRLRGWVAAPEIHRATSRGIHLYVNGRPVRDRGVQSALFDGFRGRLMRGQFPVAVLLLDLPPDAVDVNVHPAKSEVRFSDGRAVRGAVTRAVIDALSAGEKPRWRRPAPDPPGPAPESDPGGGAPVPRSASPELPSRHPPQDGVFGSKPPLGFPQTADLSSGSSEPHSNQFPQDGVAGSKPPLGFPQTADSGPGLSRPSETPRETSDFTEAVPSHLKSDSSPPAYAEVAEGRPAYPPAGTEGTRSVKGDVHPSAPAENRRPAGHEQTSLFGSSRFGELRVIGQYGGVYILCESPAGLVLVDQHAAHERIVYERLRRDDGGNAPAQRLLVPETLEMSAAEAARLTEIIPSFESIGMEVEPFGGTTFVIRAVPALLGGRSLVPLLREIAERLAALDDGGGSDAGDPLDEVRKLMACHGAIRAGQRLTDREMADLLRQLDGCENPSHCPHGRPTWVRWTPRALERAFGRVT